MSALLWKAYFENDLEQFQYLLDSSRAGAASHRGGTSGPGSVGVTAGSPGRAWSSGAPNPRAKPKPSSRTGAGKAKQSQGLALTRADVNSRDAHGVTLLHRAASSASADTHGFAHTLLIQPLVDLYIQDHESGWTALHRALYAGNVAVARELMERDILDFTSSGGSTHAGGLIKIKDREGNSPFDVYARTIAPRLIPHNAAEALLPGGDTDSDDGGYMAGTEGENHGAQPRESPHDLVSIEGEEIFMFGSNKNLTLGFGDEDDRQFPERISLKRPEVLLRRFEKEHRAKFPQGPFSGHTEAEDIPAYVRFQPIHIQDVHLSKLHSAVITTDPQANLFVCGFGAGGRLGTGDQGTRFTFTTILGGGLQSRKVVAVGLGQDHTLAVTSDGELFSWGSDRFGQLGYSVISPDQKDEDPIQLSPRQVFGPLKRELIRGCAASRVHSVVFTSTSLFSFGKNDGQLGLVDSDARLLETQTVPRKVAASLFSSGITMASAIDNATACLLENHDVWVFANFGYRKVSFALSTSSPFIRDSFSAVNRQTGSNYIVKICSGGDTICALARNGEVFNLTVSQKVDSVAENPSSTTNPNKIRGALSTPQRIWSPRKDHMAAVDVDVGQEGSIILCTSAGSVWRKVKRAKISEATSGSQVIDSKAKDYKFSRIPGLTEIRGVRSNAFGAFAAVRKDNNVLKEQIEVSPSSLWDDVFPLLSFSDLKSSRHKEGLGRDSSSATRDIDGPLSIREAVLTSEDIENDISYYFENHGPSQSSDYDVKVGSTVSDIRIPCHQFLLMARSGPLRRALSTFKDTYFSEISDLCTIEYDKEGIATVIFQGLDIISIVNIVFYVYTDNIVPVWNMARQRPRFGPRYRQVRVEVMKSAAQLELRGLEKAARLISEPVKNLNQAFDSALADSTFLGSGDIEIQLEDDCIRVHSAFICQRCPFFESMFHGRAGGGWLASRRQDAADADNLVKVNLEHVNTANFMIVVRYLYGDVDEELFADCLEVAFDDFLDVVLDVLDVANELMIDRLAQICQKVIGKYVTMRNICWLLNATSSCSVSEFKNAALESICLNLEGMMENRLLDELDEDVLAELGEAVRANQLAYLPIGKGEHEQARLFEEHPDLAERVERDRKVKIDYMMLQSHLIEDEARLTRLSRTTMRRTSSSNDDLMFTMDDEHGQSDPQVDSSPSTPARSDYDHAGYDLSSPSNSLPRERVWQEVRGKGISPAASTLTTSSIGAVTPPAQQRTASTQLAKTPEHRDSALPWTTPMFQVSKLNMKDIMAQASEHTGSNISAALSAVDVPSRTNKASSFAKISQKERKRQIQAQKAAMDAQQDSKQITEGPSNQPQPQPSSPWRLPRVDAGAPVETDLTRSSESTTVERRRTSASPSLTMRQTVPGNLAAKKPSGIDHTGASSSNRRMAASPTFSQGSKPPHSPNLTQSGSASQPSPLVPKSIRHLPPPSVAEPAGSSSMTDILAQQQKEKRAREAATAKRSLQEIQEEQAFQEWWDQEEAATRARMELEAAAQETITHPKVKTGMARGRGGGRGRGKTRGAPGGTGRSDRSESKGGDGESARTRPGTDHADTSRGGRSRGGRRSAAHQKPGATRAAPSG